MSWMCSGGGGDERGAHDVEAVGVVEEGVGVELRDVPGVLALTAHGGDHLVLAFVFVGGEVAHVGDVHDVGDVVAVVLSTRRSDVLEDVGAQVAYVREVVDGRPAGVEADFAGDERCKWLFLAGEGII